MYTETQIQVLFIVSSGCFVAGFVVGIASTLGYDKKRFMPKYDNPSPPTSPWEYGAMNNLKARRNRHTGDVQFLLWNEREHDDNGWHNADKSWYSLFKPNEI